MRTKKIPIVSIVIMIFLGGCSSEGDLLLNNPSLAHTLSLTVFMPEEDPISRIGLEQNADNSIALTWETSDELQLAFVQGTIKEKRIVTVKNISEDGKKAQFEITLPKEIKDGTFNLYGVYGGGGLDDENPTNVILPTNSGNATSLSEVQNRKDVMLYFESFDIDVNSPKANISFKHLGSLFSISLKNSGSDNLNNLTEARLRGVSVDGKWAYNYNEGAKLYDLMTGEFKNMETAGNYISFKAPNNSLPNGEIVTFWAWYPPLPEKNWPETKLELRDATSIHTISINSKPERTSPTKIGKSYYLYAIWDGINLNFTDEFFNPPLGEDEYFVKDMGGLEATLGDEKDNIKRMILKGNINADDFEVMRNMSSLEYIDLNDVTIESNKIPDYAFGAEPAYAPFGKKIKLHSNSKASTQKSEFTPPEKSNIRIKEIILPINITTIGKYAFSGCVGLQGNLEVPENVINIEEGAFFGCYNFNGTLTLSENLETIGRGAFYNCSGFNGDLKIPKNITIIGKDESENSNEGYIFNGCSGFTSLTLPNEVSYIGRGVFKDCTGLNSTTGSLDLSVYKKLTKIDSEAFKGCTSFNGCLLLPEKLEYIGYSTFENCTNIPGKVIIPISLNYLGDSSFEGCTSITAYRFPHNNPIDYIPNMLPKGSTIEVPVTAYNNYKNDINWGQHTILRYTTIEGEVP